MKKLVLIPSTDTITICLPRDWVGKTIICSIHNSEEKDNEKEIKKEKRPVLQSYSIRKLKSLTFAADQKAEYKSKKNSKAQDKPASATTTRKGRKKLNPPITSTESKSQCRGKKKTKTLAKTTKGPQAPRKAGRKRKNPNEGLPQ